MRSDGGVTCDHLYCLHPVGWPTCLDISVYSFGCSRMRQGKGLESSILAVLQDRRVVASRFLW